MPIGRKKNSPNLGSQSLTAGSYRPSRCLARVVMALACKMGGRGQKLYFPSKYTHVGNHVWPIGLSRSPHIFC